MKIKHTVIFFVVEQIAKDKMTDLLPYITVAVITVTQGWVIWDGSEERVGRHQY